MSDSSGTVRAWGRQSFLALLALLGGGCTFAPAPPGDDDEKGDFTIDARGSSALVDRDLERQFIIQLAGMVKDPAFRVKPDKYFAELCKANRFAPERIQFDDEEWKVVEANMQKAPGDPRIAVAQLRGQIEERLKTMELQFEGQDNERERQNKFAIEMIQAKLQSAELSSVERQVLDKLRVELASKTMELRTQERLSMDNIAHQKDVAIADHMVDLHKAPQVMTPPTEPAGRARAGAAFQA